MDVELGVPVKCVNGHVWEECTCAKTSEFRRLQDSHTLTVTFRAIMAALAVGLTAYCVYIYVTMR